MKTSWFIPNIAYIIIIFITWVILRSILPSTSADEPDSELTDYQDKSVGIIIELNSLMITLSTLLMGGVGGILIKTHSDKNKLPIRQWITLLLSLMFGVSTIYFGYTILIGILQQLSDNYFNFENDEVLKSIKYQFYSLILSILCVGQFLFNKVAITRSRLKNETS